MNLSLYDLVTRNGNDPLSGLIEDVPIYAPEFSQIPVIVRAGTTYKTLSRVGLPTSQFRQVSAGIPGSKSTYKQNVHEMFFLDTQVLVDEAIYKGDDGATGDILYQEGQGALQSTINTIGSQTWYGQAGDGSNGFVGLRAQLLSQYATNPTITAVTASANTTSSTAYALWLNPQGVSYDVGKHGEIAFPPFTRQLIVSSNNSFPVTSPVSSANGYFAWVTNISCYIGLAVKSEYSVFGVTGCTAATPFTDKLGANLVATVPLTRRAGLTWFVNRSVYAGLQNSRTAINYQPAGAFSGAPAFSPPPREVDGYPIVVTDSITNTENNS